VNNAVSVAISAKRKMKRGYRFSRTSRYACRAIVAVLLWSFGPSATVFPTTDESVSNTRGFLAGLGGGYLVPGGTFQKDLNPGIGYGATLLYFSAWNMILFESNLLYGRYDVNFSPGSYLSQVTVTVGPGLYFPVFDWLQPYVSLQGGVNYLSFTFSQTGAREDAYKPIGLMSAGLLVQPFD